MTRAGYFFRIISGVLMFAVLAAHFFRWSQVGLVAVTLLAPTLLISKRRWSLTVVQLLLVAGAVVWLQTGIAIVQQRSPAGEPWVRAAIIMTVVALATIGAAVLLRSPGVRHRYIAALSTAGASVAAFLLVVVIGAFPQIKMHDPIPLLAERFLPGAGWVELLLLAIYAAWLVEMLLSAKATDRIRRNVWIGFSIIFFVQAALGVAGVSKLLMTGTLHLPIPAMIAAAPFYRAELSLFMPILLGTTLLLAGPAWCSWFCYLGSWDFLASRTKTAPGLLTGHTIALRFAVLAALCGSAAVLRIIGVPTMVAAALGIFFGTGGIAVMLLISRKRGIMVHCTTYCPIGLIATVAGKISPFRIRIGAGCTKCQSCTRSCRYGALTPETINARSPGRTCTLCGDCLSGCPHTQIGYRFAGCGAATAKRAFFVIVVAIHALFMGFGRI